MRTVISDETKIRYRYPARAIGLVGAVLMIVSIFLPWAYGHGALDDVGYAGAPSPLQLFFVLLPVLLLLLLAAPLVGKSRLGRFAKVVAWNTTAKTAAIGATATVLVALAAMHGYATGKSVYAPALGHSDDAELDRRFQRALGVMLRSYLGEPE